MLEVTDDAGPRRPPSSRPSVGLTEPTSRLYRVVDARPGQVEDALLERCDVELGPTSELSYAVFPAWSGPPGRGQGFEATAVAVDLLLDDGTWASARPVRDQAGYPADADAQYRSKALVVDQWNLRTVDLSALAGRRAVATYLRAVGVDEVGPRHGLRRRVPHGWLSDVRVGPRAPGPDGPERLVDLVDTRRGTHSSGEYSRGNTIPAVALPQGFNFAIPVTDASSYTWPYRYHADNRADGSTPLQAIAVSHAPSPWIGDRSVMQVMPLVDASAPDVDRAARELTFRHDDELAGPHRYRVALAGGVVAEATATAHVMVARFTVPDGGGVVLDQPDDRGSVEVTPDGTVHVRGWTDGARPGLEANAPRMYFVARVDGGVAWHREAAVPDRPHVSAVLATPPGPDGTVTVRVATSFVSLDQAERSLDLEAPPSTTFDELVDEAAARWEELLGRVRIDEPDRGRRVAFVSSLYRLFLYPNDASENAGTAERPRWIHADASTPPPAAHGPTRTGCVVRDGRSTVNHGFWDTYRTCWPAYGLLAPELAADLLDGFVEHYRASGWIDRWSAPGPVNSMVGTSSDLVVADALASGVPVRDVLAAYDSGLRNATTVSPDSRVGRADNGRAIFTGYVSTGTHEGLSWTLEGALTDYGLAVTSAWLLDHLPVDHPRREELRANEVYFRAKALRYATLFAPDAGFFVGRDDVGRFRPARTFDPRIWGGDYTETNAWGMAFSVPHDGHGLAALHGGPDALEAKLDAYFATEETGDASIAGTYGSVIHEMTEARNVRRGMFALSNQPAHHAPFMYAFTGAPWKTHELVRDSVRRLFLGSEIGQGYPGDEDNGEMSAWYVFAVLGLYPLAPGSGELLLTAPAVARATLDLDGGRETTVVARDLAPENVYVQSVTVDGRPWHRLAIPVATLRAGVEIEIALGPEPSTWGTGPDAAPFAVTPRGSAPARLVDHADPAGAREHARSSVGDPALVFDDSSDAGIVLRPGDWAGYELAADASVDLYTVSLGAPADGLSWVLERADGDTWVELDRRDGVGFVWPRQTRAFLLGGLRGPGPVRLRVLRGTLDLRQLELLGERA
ncbi:GH92 family glycosyl hydrolase [Luteimicrobium sp. DT211]|uniref:GH92 family glycosyl hydrolase n=1 Tax=Luteimicrobium sp. DT211 TaxID=3393412 RepID=UPI003CF5D42E